MRTNCEEHKAQDTTREMVRILKAKKETKPVIVDKSANVGNALVRKARRRIILIVVNLVILLVIALSQR